MCASRVDTITDPLKKIELFKALASPAFIGKTINLFGIFYCFTVISYFLLFYCYLVFSTFLLLFGIFYCLLLFGIFYCSTVIWYFLLFYCYLVFSTVPPFQWPA